MKNTFWTWNWKNGGYNSCSISEAPTLKAAKAKAAAIGAPDPNNTRSVRLVAEAGSFRQVTTAEMVAIDRSWASAFD